MKKGVILAIGGYILIILGAIMEENNAYLGAIILFIMALEKMCVKYGVEE